MHHCLLAAIELCLIWMNTSVAFGETSQLFINSDHFSASPDGSFLIKNQRASAEYLVGVLEGRISSSISVEFRGLIAKSVCRNVRTTALRRLSHESRERAQNLIKHSQVVLESKTETLPFKEPTNLPLHPLVSLGMGKDDSIYICLHGQDFCGAVIAKYSAKSEQLVWQTEVVLGKKALEGVHRCNTFVLCSPREVAVIAVTETQILVAFLSADNGSLIDHIEINYIPVAKPSPKSN